MLGSLSQATAFARGAVRRLPVETAIVATAALITIVSIHSQQQSLWYLRILLAAVLAGPLAFALHERADSRPQRWATAGGAAIFALALIAMVLCLRTDANVDQPRFQWAYGLLTLAAYLVPFIAARARFATFVRRFFEELTTWGLLGAVAAGALGVLAFAITELFDLDARRLGADAVLIATAAIVLIALERLLPDRASGGKVPELWRRLATAIGAPFVSAMLLILLVYELTVVVRGELPRNLLSPLIIGAGFVGYVCTLILTAVASEPVGTAALSPADPHRFLRHRSVRLARAFPLVLLVLLPMAIWALYLRIDQYGLTPFRLARCAALLCLVVLGALGSVRWLRGQAPLGWQVPTCLATFALLLAAGPLSAVNLSIRSQAAHLSHLLDQAEVRDRQVAEHDGRASRVLPEPQWTKLRDAIEALARLGGQAALRRSLSGEVGVCAERWSGAEACLHRLGLTSARQPDYQPPSRYETGLTYDAVAIPAGELRFITVTEGTPEDPTNSVRGTTLRLSCGKDSWSTASLAEYAAATAARQPLPTHGIPLTGCANAGQFFLRSIDLRITITDPQPQAGSPAEAFEITRVDGVWVRPSP